MHMIYTAAEREEAIKDLLCFADTYFTRDWEQVRLIGDDTTMYTEASLARTAWLSIRYADSIGAHALDAAQLLAEGYTPGDDDWDSIVNDGAPSSDQNHFVPDSTVDSIFILAVFGKLTNQ